MLFKPIPSKLNTYKNFIDLFQFFLSQAVSAREEYRPALSHPRQTTFLVAYITRCWLYISCTHIKWQKIYQTHIIISPQQCSLLPSQNKKQNKILCPVHENIHYFLYFFILIFELLYNQMFSCNFSTSCQSESNLSLMEENVMVF